MTVDTSKPQALTIFTWGYWGWGNATPQFVQGADAVERSRGYAPPVFVDIRISRSVRARGFNGAQFEQTVGASRYRWMRSLGNAAILDGGRQRIRIGDPASASELLDVAEDHHSKGRRVLFFCSCDVPGIEGRGGCHRATVAGLVLKAAARRNLKIRIVEWPGGEPLEPVPISVTPDVLRTLDAGQKSILLGQHVSLAKVAAMPWYSLAEVSGPDRKLPPRPVLTGPAKYEDKRGWWLPKLEGVDPAMSRQSIHQRIRELRTENGFDPRGAV